VCGVVGGGGGGGGGGAAVPGWGRAAGSSEPDLGVGTLAEMARRSSVGLGRRSSVGLSRRRAAGGLAEGAPRPDPCSSWKKRMVWLSGRETA
jgi:hypothetical protein